MGQTTYALLYGCKMRKPPKALGDEGWWTLAAQYSPKHEERPEVDYSDEHRTHFLGFFVAVGASGKDGVPDLGSFPLDDAPKTYKAAYSRAVNAFVDFARWAHEAKGIGIA